MTRPSTQTQSDWEGPVKLQVQKQGIPKAILYRQLQPQRYAQFEAKTTALRKSLAETLAYLESLNGKPPALMRISAFSAEVSLDWDGLRQTITPEEEVYRSFGLMKDAAQELQSLSRYWVTSERLRRTFRGTLREEQEDIEVMRIKRDKIRQALAELDKFEQMKKDLKSELPY